MKLCAYCGEACQTTKEHIWPRSLIAKYEKLKTYNPKTDSFYVGEPVVKDVCARCNNEKLSLLDNYLAATFDDCIGQIVERGDMALLRYDYDLLLRALLKISYNSSRTSESEKSESLHRTLASYILHGGYHRRIMLRLQIVTPSTMLNAKTGEKDELIPTLMRCGIIPYDGPLSHRFLVRLIAINSFWFYLVLPYKDEPEHKWKKFLLGFTNWKMPTGVEVRGSVTALSVHPEMTTYLHPHLLGALWTSAQSRT